MPLYNCEKFVSEAIESVIAQSYHNWALIVVDDKSTDKSMLIVKNYTNQDSRIKMICLDNNVGPTQARNRAIKEAQGRYIAFLDSDDIWLPTKLEKQIEFMEKKKSFLSYTSYYVINEKSETTGIFHVKKRVTYDDMLKTSTIGTLTTVYNAEKLGKYYFKEIGHEDYVMKLQILKDIDYAEGVKEPLAKYRVTNKGLSRNKFRTALWQWKIYRNIEHLSIIKSMYYFIHYVYFGLKKYN